MGAVYSRCDAAPAAANPYLTPAAAAAAAAAADKVGGGWAWHTAQLIASLRVAKAARRAWV